MGNKVYLGLGSNKGDRINYLRNAVSELNSLPDSSVLKCSLVYETKPYGGIEQQNFYNAVCLLETDLDLIYLFEKIKTIEGNLGRSKSERWGPREIDIDILLYNDLIYTGESLMVPHKELVKRDFVVVPILDIDPGIVHPVLKIKLNEIVFQEVYIINKIEYNLLTTVGD